MSIGNVNEFLYILSISSESWNNIVHRIGKKRAEICLDNNLIQIVSKNTENEARYGLTNLGKKMLKDGIADKYIKELEEG